VDKPVRALRAAASLVAAAGTLVAMPPVAAQQVFRTTTDMVFLSVTATRGNQIVPGLTAADFLVFEDGRPQEVAVFSPDPQPIALSLLVDASMSMETKLGLASDAAVGFVGRMRPGDTAQVVAFNDRTDIRQEFTADRALLERAIRTTRASGSTSLYTALYIAFSELERADRQGRGEIRRQAVVLLSDGEDTTSLLDQDAVIDRAKRSDVVVFAIGLRDPTAAADSFRRHDFAMRVLTQTTGGRVVYADAASQLPAIYNQIADELAAQYTIGYTSTNTGPGGRWRDVAVRVKRAGVSARTRAGYFSPASTP
jgi:Ca-activated chloride channel family protein